LRSAVIWRVGEGRAGRGKKVVRGSLEKKLDLLDHNHDQHRLNRKRKREKQRTKGESFAAELRRKRKENRGQSPPGGRRTIQK